MRKLRGFETLILGMLLVGVSGCPGQYLVKVADGKTLPPQTVVNKSYSLKISVVEDSKPVEPGKLLFKWSMKDGADWKPLKTGVGNDEIELKVEPKTDACDYSYQVRAEVEVGGVTLEHLWASQAQKIWCNITKDGKETYLVNSVALGQEGEVLVGTVDGLYAVSGEELKEVSVPTLPGSVDVIWASPTSKEIWLGSKESNDVGAVRVSKNDDGTFKTQTYSVKNKLLGDNTVYSFAKDKDGQMLVGTFSGLYKAETGELIPESASQEVGAIAVTRSKGLVWFGSRVPETLTSNWGNGLALYTPSVEKSVVLDRTKWVSGQIARNHSVLALAVDGARLYVGLNKFSTISSGVLAGGLTVGSVKKYSDFSEEPEMNSWTHYNSKTTPEMPGDKVRSLAFGKSYRAKVGGTTKNLKEVWVGTSTGLGRFNPALGAGKKWSSIPFKAAKSGMLSDQVKGVVYDSKADALWIGTEDGGLTRFYVGHFDAAKKVGQNHAVPDES